MHTWKFFRTGELDQVSLETGADLLNLEHLDQKLWVALSCPVKGLELDEKTLALIDTDGDSRIRVPELIAAIKWAAARLKAGQTPGPEGSLSKLMWTQNMRRMSDAMSTILGARLTADTGEWGTFAWTEQVLGAPGYRIAGGSDEVQRNIIGERVLQLPLEPRVDKDISFADAQRLARKG